MANIFKKEESDMKTQSALQRTLQALFITGISIFALTPAFAQDLVKVTTDKRFEKRSPPNVVPGERSWVLQERTLPVPAAASEALKDSIAKAPQPDVARSQGTTFQTNEEWVKISVR